MARADETVVFPTPPFPPTNTTLGSPAFPVRSTLSMSDLREKSAVSCRTYGKRSDLAGTNGKLNVVSNGSQIVAAATARRDDSMLDLWRCITKWFRGIDFLILGLSRKMHGGSDTMQFVHGSTNCRCFLIKKILPNCVVESLYTCVFYCTVHRKEWNPFWNSRLCYTHFRMGTTISLFDPTFTHDSEGVQYTKFILLSADRIGINHRFHI